MQSAVEGVVEIVAESGESNVGPEDTPDAVIGFEAGPVRFEACTEFRGSAQDPLVCGCGWLEDDHGELAVARAGRQRRRSTIRLPERRAS